jgi:hypothetical protein
MSVVRRMCGMKIMLSSRRLRHVARAIIFLIVVALVAGMVSCIMFPSRLTLTITSTDGGSVTVPGEGTFTYFVPQCCPTEELVAEADEGYRFVEWTGGYVDNPDAAITWVMIGSDESITAHFGPECTPMITAGSFHTVGLKDNGRVFAVGDNYHGQCDVSSWRGIIQVAAGGNHTVGIKFDGTAVAIGDNYDGQCDVGAWNITHVAAGYWHTAGLKDNGTVVAVGNNDDGQCDVSDWTDITHVAAGGVHTVGLKSDGTVVAVGNNDFGQCNVGNWTDITRVATGGVHTVGLKSDGSVVAVGNNYFGQCNVGNWTDIIQVAAGGSHTVGLKSNGTVVAVGNN